VAYGDDGDHSRRIVHLVNDAMDADPKAVCALSADHLSHSCRTWGQAEFGDAFEAAAAGLRGEAAEVLFHG
jgi:hypothetical protein